MKKVISILLAVIMILSVAPLAVISFAEANEYPYRNSTKLLEKSTYGFYVKTCLDYVAWKVNTYSGLFPKPEEECFNRLYGGKNWDDLTMWDENAAALGFTVDTTPALGAVAFINPHNEKTERGQLAWVRAFLPDGRVCFETYDWGSAMREYAYVEAEASWADGYIHFKDLEDNNCPRNRIEVTAKPGRYMLQNVATGYVMTYGRDLRENEFAPIIASQVNESKAQLFYIRHSAAGKYGIELTHEDGGVVNIWRDKGEAAKVGDFVTAYTKNNSDQLQQFYFTPVRKDPTADENSAVKDLYIIQSYTDTKMVIASSSTACDEQLTIAKYNPTDIKQLWRLIPYKDYTVSFDANGGSTPVNKITVAYHSEYGTLPIPTRKGYTFIGWYTEKDKGVKVNEDTRYELTEDQTLYAHWFYEAHMDLNGDDKCDDCGADAQTFCECLCHNKTSSIKQMLYKIILIFWKLLNVKNNQYCSCGKQHF